MEAGGADALEIGVPFSDPIADGPTIQTTSHRALQAGVSIASILDLVRELRGTSEIPVVLMTYLNPVLAYGEEAFFRDAAEAGVDAVLATDLPPDERAVYWDGAREAGLDRIVLIAPTTPAGRLPRLLERASGFVYCLTRTGVTGKGKGFAENLEEQIRGIHAHSGLPVAAGFGIRSAENISGLPADLDGVVIGARLMEIVLEAADIAGAADGLTVFLRSLSPSLRLPV